jgi:two-component system nitrogen regulation response regulator GlnG/two-component system response regulator HydG
MMAFEIVIGARDGRYILAVSGETTLDSGTMEPAGETRPAPRAALVVVWCESEPWRVGEVIVMPPSGDGRGLVLGRGDGGGGSKERAKLARQRPGESVETAPLEAGHISREQLVLKNHPDGGIAIENVGKRALVVRGAIMDAVRVRAGDVVEIKNQLVMIACERPAIIPPLRTGDGRLAPAFGEADAFGYVGESPEAWRLRDEIAIIGARREHVLVLGDSGTGKELTAQALHAMSARAARRLIARNAATVPSGIIDAELFGNAANYPNAGMPERPGLIGEADGSTLFLDEIGELPIELQTHLLRVLDGGDYQRLGDARRRTADVRLVAATNRPVAQLKSDLAARFPIRLRVPGLHERREDIALIAHHLLKKMIASRAPSAASSAEPRMSKDLAVALAQHLYTTHAREIATVLFRAMVESRGDAIELTPGARELLGLAPAATPSAAPPPASDTPHVTREAIVEALARCEGVQARAWRELGLANRYVLRRLMKKHGIDGADDKDE